MRREVYRHMHQAGRRQLSKRNRQLVALAVAAVVVLLLAWYIVAAQPTVPAILLAMIVAINGEPRCTRG